MKFQQNFKCKNTNCSHRSHKPSSFLFFNAENESSKSVWGTFRPHLKSNAIWRPVAMYFTRWLIRITTLVRFCIFSVKGWFRGGHSYEFLRICYLVKYDFLHVWICMIKVVKYVRLAVRLGWNLLTVDSCCLQNFVEQQYMRPHLYTISLPDVTMPQSAIKVFSMLIRVFLS